LELIDQDVVEPGDAGYRILDAAGTIRRPKV